MKTLEGTQRRGISMEGRCGLFVWLAVAATWGCSGNGDSSGGSQGLGGTSAQGGADTAGTSASRVTGGADGAVGTGTEPLTGGNGPNTGGTSSRPQSTTGIGGTAATGGKSAGSGGKSTGTGGTRPQGTMGAGGSLATGGKSAGSGGKGAGGNAIGGTLSPGGAGTGGRTNQAPAGCGEAPTSTRGAYFNVTVGTLQRRYWLSLPANYDANKQYPVVFAFHGGGDTGQGFSGWLGVEEASPGQAIFVYPDGINNLWEAEVYNGDFRLVDAILDVLEANYCINQAAVFAIGFSWGGWAVTQFACARSALVKGIISIAGGGPLGTCTNVTASMIVHGSADTSEPIRSGESTRNKLITRNTCSQTSQAVSPSPCVEYDNCQERLLWCAHSRGHEIPASVQQGAMAFFAAEI